MRPRRPAFDRSPRRDGVIPREGGARAPIPRERGFRYLGVAAATAEFSARPNAAERVFFDAKRQAAARPLAEAMAARRKPYRMVETAELDRVAGTPLHGGLCLVGSPPPLRLVAAAEVAGWAKEGPLVLLDGVGNPHNLGAILRSAAFFGLKRLLISDHPDQAGLSEAAVRVAEGGHAAVTVARLEAVPASLRSLSQAFRVIATTLRPGPSLSVAELTGPGTGAPPLIVLGAEETGLSAATQAACPFALTLRGSGAVQSLNVAQTAAIIIHGMAR